MLGALALLTGAGLILTLPVPWPARGALALVWLLVEGARLNRLARLLRCLRWLRIDDTTVRGCDMTGSWQALTWRRGSRVGRRFGWLRFRTAAGAAIDLPCSLAGLGATRWRRLRVLAQFCQ